MNISEAGASLLATLFPISLLILIVEARSAGPYTGRRGVRLFWETLHELGVAGAIISTLVCAVAVCSGIRVSGFWFQVVLVAGIYQLAAVTIVAVRLVRGIERGH
jgi:ABC-type sulfate transport system permease component